MDKLLVREQMHNYQYEMVSFKNTHPHAMVWAFLGSGKTCCTLTSIVDRMQAKQVKKVLIIAPLRVCYAVWEREAKKWEHTKHLKFSIIHGNPEQRRQAFFRHADIYLVNYEGLPWLTSMLIKYFPNELPWEMCVYDEISCVKNSESVRMKKTSKRDKIDKETGEPLLDDKGKPIVIIKKGWRNISDRFLYTIGLTGTPSSNGYIDLFGQYLVIDGGKRLFSFISHYRDAYFRQSRSGFGYEINSLGAVAIQDKIKDITLSMNNAKDYLDLPKVVVKNMFIDLPPKAKAIYEKMEKEMYVALDENVEVEVFNKAALSNKCMQIASGSCYTDLQGSYKNIHTAKLEALDEVMEEAAGTPVLVAYNFTCNAEVIMKKFKKYNPVCMTGAKGEETLTIIDNWNKGKVGMIIAHPKCLVKGVEVLTEYRGWVDIVDVHGNERVYDGIEFVKHDGVMYSGYEEVIDVFEIGMTKAHKLLVNNTWTEGKNVSNSEGFREKARYKYKGDDKYLSQMFEVRDSKRDSKTECGQTQQKTISLVSLLSSKLEVKGLWNLESHERKVSKPESKGLQELWSKRYIGLRRVGYFLWNILGGYEKRLHGHNDNRESKRKRSLRKKQLYMGINVCSTREQKKQSNGCLSRSKNALSGIMSGIGYRKNNVNNEDGQRNDSRPSGSERKEQPLPKQQKSCKCEEKKCKKEHVYDLVNCGKRNRFLIRNKKHEVFVSHNSAGHGLDGLQLSGTIVCWIGLTWNLEYYLQTNGRIDRQGQKNVVSIIRILARDTIDMAVADAIDMKHETQQDLKDSIQKYRRGEVSLNYNKVEKWLMSIL